MRNPWGALPESADFVLPQDAEEIHTFNDKARPAHWIHLELLPEPYLGSPHARILLLNLNPGYHEEDVLFHQGQPYFIKTSRKNVLHAPLTYPLYLLDPQNQASPGAQWWMKKLRWLTDRYGAATIANELCVVEYFPYHSRSYGFPHMLPSQRYSFALVEAAMHRNAVIIQMRSKNEWQKALPQLQGYPNYHAVINWQNPTISPKNCPDGSAAIVKMLG